MLDILIFIIVLAIFLFLICGVGLLITLGVWYARIHPYFKEANDFGYKVYKAVSNNFYIAIALIIISILIFLCYSWLYCKKKQSGSGLIIFIIIIILVYTLFYIVDICILTFSKTNNAFSGLIKIGFLVSKRGNTNNSGCFNYLTEGLKGTDSYYKNDTKYIKWRSNFVAHAFNKDNYTKKYLCQNVGSPTAVFIILQLIILFFCILIFCLICQFSNENDDSNIASNDEDLSTKLIQ